jgi:hypothetical protein
MKQMNRKMKRWSWIIVALLPLLWAGCTRQEIDNREVVQSKYITVTAVMDDYVSTYGAPINSASELTDFGFFCSYTGTDSWDPLSDVPNKMFDVEMIRNASGFWDYADTPVVWDNTSAADCYTFFAYAPFGTAENGLSVVSQATDPGIPELKYTVPVTVQDQPDLMIAEIRENIHPTGHPVALKMRHALTAIGFELAGDGETVEGISISGVSVSGRLPMYNGAFLGTLWWKNLGPLTNTDYSASISGEIGRASCRERVSVRV